ncbi:hypothetical protein STEG23_001302, partial [Scotinomys teguina]
IQKKEPDCGALNEMILLSPVGGTIQITFYILVKAIYTLGYSVSLMSLTTGSIIICLFRKLHCTRNYIHLNLFLSFILRAISVLVKDSVLYSSSGTLRCHDQQASWVGCKLSLVFFQYCIMANFYWLLVEGLYLHTLLVAILPPSRCFLAYLLIGWGIPSVCIGAWTATRISLEDTGCWDTNDQSIPWWVIRMPILISIVVNFALFISIIRILLQKLTSPDVGGNDQSQYKRLAKSTLLLIPLFGVHYMVFAAFPIGISSTYQILFELCVGSFQGLVVAVLYCFLNSEVSLPYVEFTGHMLPLSHDISVQAGTSLPGVSKLMRREQNPQVEFKELGLKETIDSLDQSTGPRGPDPLDLQPSRNRETPDKTSASGLKKVP